MFVPVNRGTIFRTERYLGLIDRLFVFARISRARARPRARFVMWSRKRGQVSGYCPGGTK
jgi:hypothetical protein